MILGAIADDLTGGADVAGLLAARGLATRLVAGVPDASARPGAEALVVALKSRSAPVDEAVRGSLAALAWLRAAGAGRVIQKVCSTFDSTPTGNIGPVALALLDALGAAGAAVCPAFPANGRTVYQGHLFVGDRLLSESGMERHPLTPMTDPDLRRWLARQGTGPVGHLPLAALRAGGGAAALRAAHERGERLVVVDAVEDEDILRLGAAMGDAPLVVGGSAVTLGLVPRGATTPRARPGVAGPGLALAGSCSRATLAQVAAHAARHPVHRVDPVELADPAAARARARAFLRAHRGERPLVASSAAPEAVAAAQGRWGREALAARLDALFAGLARDAGEDGFAALVVAGGETSGAAAEGLGRGAWEVGAEVAPGVPTLYPEGGGPIRGLVLKSGNFGGEGLFDAALDALRAGR